MDYTKYTDSLAMMDKIVASTSAVRVGMGYREIPITKEEKEITSIHTQWDDLYTFVYDNFKAPDSSRAEGAMGKDSVTVTPEIESELASMKEMFKLTREEIEEQLYKIPPTILEQCFPVWMARYMLCFCNVPISPVNLTTFAKFHRMYGYMIIYCD